MTPTPKLTSGATIRADAAAQDASAAPQVGPFVLNLCSSTTPMALPKAEQPELKRFSFFVSRRFEEGRERFRLHMGYFATLAEAEEWLGAVRDIYPGAWAGEAPGKKLRERAVAAAAAQAAQAAGPPPQAAPAPVAARTSGVVSSGLGVELATVPVVRPAAAPPVPEINVPTLHAATPSPAHVEPPLATVRSVPAVRPAAPVVVGKPAAAAPVAKATAAPPAVKRPEVRSPVPTKTPAASAPIKTAPQTASNTVAKPASADGRIAAVASRAAAISRVAAKPAAVAIPLAAALASKPPAARSAATPVGVQPRASQTSTPPASSVAPSRVKSNLESPARTLSNSRPTQGPPAGRPQGIKPTSKPALPNSNVREVLAALSESPGETTGETRLMPAPALPTAEPTDDAVFTDTQVLKFLETRRTESTPGAGVDVETGAISLLKPDDTGTRRALKQAVVDNAPVSFAVQLQWSVQPIELEKVPPLAIFSAYTLYTVEGSRDGRRWYGLRLGFFTDAISAKQVAYYVRSEFTSVAVVPVSPQERTRASDADKKAAEHLASPKRLRSDPTDEFKLIDSDVVPASTAAAIAPQRLLKPGASATGKGDAAKGSRGPRVRARERRGPQTLEETLEILGASELEIDRGNGETLNESGVRHLRVEVQKNTPFSRLLERLSEKVRKT